MRSRGRGSQFGRSHVAAWIKSCPKPWVVADWGVLRALQSGSGLPGGFTVLIHDRMFAEALGSARPEQFRHKLDQIIVHPDSVGRVLIGRYWNDVVDDEHSPERVYPASIAAIDVGLSNGIRHEQDQGRTFLAGGGVTVPEGWVDKRDRFIDLMNRYVEYMRNHPELLRVLQNQERLHGMIGIPTTELAEAVLQTDGRYRSPEWTRLLTRFPDVCAIGRFLRTMTWYAMRRASAAEEREEEFGQNYDDSHYVFASLYTKHLWTQDQGMRRAALAVSGGCVHVHESWESIPRYCGGEERQGISP